MKSLMRSPSWKRIGWRPTDSPRSSPAPIVSIQVGKQLAEIPFEEQVGQCVPVEVELLAESAGAGPPAGVAAESAQAGRVGLVGGTQTEHEPLAAGEREIAEQIDPVGPLAGTRRPVVDGAHAAAQRAEQDEGRAPDRAARQREPAPDPSGSEKRRAELHERFGAVREGVHLERDVLVGELAAGVTIVITGAVAAVVMARCLLRDGWGFRLRAAGGQVHGAFADEDMARDHRLRDLALGHAIVEAHVPRLRARG